MSDLFVNIRFGEWHFQIGRNRPHVRISRNPSHSPANRDDDWRWFQIYELRLP